MGGWDAASPQRGVYIVPGTKTLPSETTKVLRSSRAVPNDSCDRQPIDAERREYMRPPEAAGGRAMAYLELLLLLPLLLQNTYPG